MKNITSQLLIQQALIVITKAPATKEWLGLCVCK